MYFLKNIVVHLQWLYCRVRELWELEERRREEEEEEEAERAEGLEEDNLTPPALTTPVASATSIGQSKQSLSSGARKKKK